MVVAIEKDNLVVAYEMLQHLSNKTVLKMIDIVRDNPGVSLTDIYIALRMAQSTVSLLVTATVKSGVLKFEAEGKKHLYYVDEERIEKLSNILSKFGETCTNITIKDLRERDPIKIVTKVF